MTTNIDQLNSAKSAKAYASEFGVTIAEIEKNTGVNRRSINRYFTSNKLKFNALVIATACILNKI